MLDMDFDMEDLDDSKKDLQTVLPRLARRITQKQQSVTGDRTITSVLNPAQRSPSSSAKQREGDDDNADQTQRSATGGARRRHTRRSVTGSICYAAQDLPPEIRSLREQDIYNEPDSAADRALHAVSQMASNNSGGGGAEDGGVEEPALERRSSSAQRVEGRLVQQDHAQYALTYGMMLGIRCTTGRKDQASLQQQAQQQRSSTASNSNSSPPSSPLSPLSPQMPQSKQSPQLQLQVEEERELLPEDYAQTTKLLFLPEGNSGGPFPTPPHRLPFAFGFKDYTPSVFRALRALNNVEEADYMTSLAGDFNYIEFLANSKSGQFFFYSHDGRFMIKTQTREEAKLLREMLPSYVRHLAERPDSLLARFYGLHRVEMPTLKRRTFFVVMQSVFYCPVEPPLALHAKFDLKGSSVGRRTDDADCADGAVMKDLNFAEQRRRVALGKDTVLLFAETLRADTQYLRDLRIMDYSLLLGVHDPHEERRLQQQQQQQQLSQKEKERMQRRRSSGGVVLARRRDSTQNAQNAQRGSVRFDIGHDKDNNDNGDDKDEDSELWLQQQRLPSQWASPSVFNSHCGGVRGADPVRQEVYFMGIIDILQVYNANKRLENFFKGFSHDRRQLSAVDPALYAERMVSFLLQHSDYADAIAASKSSARQPASAMGRPQRSLSSPATFFSSSNANNNSNSNSNSNNNNNNNSGSSQKQPQQKEQPQQNQTTNQSRNSSSGSGSGSGNAATTNTTTSNSNNNSNKAQLSPQPQRSSLSSAASATSNTTNNTTTASTASVKANTTSNATSPVRPPPPPLSPANQSHLQQHQQQYSQQHQQHRQSVSSAGVATSPAATKRQSNSGAHNINNNTNRSTSNNGNTNGNSNSRSRSTAEDHYKLL